MRQDIPDIQTLLDKVGSSAVEFSALAAGFSPTKFNALPEANVWSAAMIVRHITKATDLMNHALLQESIPANRDPSEKVEQLKKTFLDFELKMKTPEIAAPENIHYRQADLIDDFQNTFVVFAQNVGKANLNELVENLPISPVTKFEICNFVLFHLQRHLHQLKELEKLINTKN